MTRPLSYTTDAFHPLERDSTVPSDSRTRFDTSTGAIVPTRFVSVCSRARVDTSAIAAERGSKSRPAATARIEPGEPPLVAVSVQRAPKKRVEKLLSLQTWEGFVTEVREDAIVARLVDLTDREPEIEVELSRDEIPVSDHPLIRRGAVFYWHISYVDKPNGQRTRSSEIRFRRLPTWRAEGLAAAAAEAERLGRLLGWE